MTGEILDQKEVQLGNEVYVVYKKQVPTKGLQDENSTVRAFIKRVR